MLVSGIWVQVHANESFDKVAEQTLHLKFSNVNLNMAVPPIIGNWVIICQPHATSAPIALGEYLFYWSL